MALERAGMVLAERSASANAPEVDVVAPDGGDLHGIQVARWVATDPDGDALTYALFYSADDGAGWQPLAMSLATPAFLLDLDALPGGTARLRVLATDGFHTTAAVSAAFTVAPKAPAVRIAAPEPNAVLAPHMALLLRGAGHDPEDGPLPDEALSWWSDRSGLLGRGAPLVLPGATLPTGPHTITLIGTDADGQMGRKSITVYVGHVIHVPATIKR
jgi:hypothetical protein